MIGIDQIIADHFKISFNVNKQGPTELKYMARGEVLFSAGNK